MQNNNKASKAQSGLFCFWKVWHEWWNMEECTCLVSLCSSGSRIHCCCLPILTFTLEQLRWGLENFQGIQLSYLFLKKLDYICKLTSVAPVDAGAHCWRQFSCVCPFIDNELSNLSLSTLTFMIYNRAVGNNFLSWPEIELGRNDNLVPRALVTLVQRNGKTKTSGILCFSSTFHWPTTEHAQLYRKLINNNFVPRFPIQSRERWMCKRWVW